MLISPGLKVIFPPKNFLALSRPHNSAGIPIASPSAIPYNAPAILSLNSMFLCSFQIHLDSTTCIISCCVYFIHIGYLCQYTFIFLQLFSTFVNFHRFLNKYKSDFLSKITTPYPVLCFYFVIFKKTPEPTFAGTGVS